MLSWKLRGLGAAALIPFGLTTAWAQDRGTSGDDGVRLNPISITATRNPIDAFDYPGMVSVVGPEDIRARQASTPDDLLGSLPNVGFTGGPRRTGEVPAIRGFSGADIVATLDGARQNFLSDHDGRFFIDPVLLREVEVLRGSASSLYGSGATGDVIALRTVRARTGVRRARERTPASGHRPALHAAGVSRQTGQPPHQRYHWRSPCSSP